MGISRFSDLVSLFLVKFGLECCGKEKIGRFLFSSPILGASAAQLRNTGLPTIHFSPPVDYVHYEMVPDKMLHQSLNRN